MAHVKNEKIRGQFCFTVNVFSRLSHIQSPPFKLAGHSFRLAVFPVDGEYIGFSMIHLSPTSCDASYSITLKCHDVRTMKDRKEVEHGTTTNSTTCTCSTIISKSLATDDGNDNSDANDGCWTEEGDYTWADPDGIVHFTERDHEDSKWGNEEYIHMDMLFDKSNGLIISNSDGSSSSTGSSGGSLTAGKVVFVIDLTIHGSDSLLSYTADNHSNYDTKLIELITDEDCNPYDLMNYVDNDIEGIMKHSSSTSNVNNELVKKKQNLLVSTALYNNQYK